jgi:hypothetical protein
MTAPMMDTWRHWLHGLAPVNFSTQVLHFGSVLKEAVAFVILERREDVLKRYGRYCACCMVALVFLVLLAGCSGEGIQAVGGLIPLQRQLVAQFEASDISVELQGGSTLGVTLVNSLSNDLAWDEKAEQAREIASFACENYASMDRIDRVRVAFAIHQDGTMVDATGSATFTFEKSELACGDN